MKIEKYTKLKGNQYEVILDGLSVKLYDDVIVRYELIRRKEIDADLFREITSYNDFLEAYYKALKYLTKKLRTEKEIFHYLEKDYSRPIVQDTIVKLKQDGYLNEDIYIKCYLSDQLTMGTMGPTKIERELVKLGCDVDKVKEQIQTIKDDVWMERIDRLVKKRIKGNHSYGNQKLKEKLVYELGNQGYYKWMIDEVLANSSFANMDALLEKEYQKNYEKLSKKYEGAALEMRLTAKLLAKGFSYEEIKKILTM